METIYYQFYALLEQHFKDDYEHVNTFLLN